jgi:hypothetical protein
VLAVLDYNLYFGAVDNCASCTPGDNAIFDDPLLADTVPGNDSPAIDSGVVIDSELIGGFVGNGPDLGAIEVR